MTCRILLGTIILPFQKPTSSWAGVQLILVEMIETSNNLQSFEGMNFYTTTYANPRTFPSASTQNSTTHLVSPSHSFSSSPNFDASQKQKDLRNSHIPVEPYLPISNLPEHSERLFLMDMCSPEDSFSIAQDMVRLAHSPTSNHYNSAEYAFAKSQYDIRQRGISGKFPPSQLLHSRSSLLDIPENSRHYRQESTLDDFKDYVYDNSHQYPTAYSTCTSSSSSSNYQTPFSSNAEIDLQKISLQTPPTSSDFTDDGSHLLPQQMISRTLPRPLGFQDREFISTQPLVMQTLLRGPGLSIITIPPTPASMMGQFNYKLKGAASTQKKNMCTICDKRFTRLSSLQTHIYSHTGAKRRYCF
jgi:hypothetical protein